MIILSGKTKVGIRKFLRNLTYTQKFQISAFFMFSAFLLSMVYFYFLSLHSTILTIEFILEFLLFASMLFMMFGFLSFLLFKQATIELGAEPSEIRDVITRYLKGHALINDKKYFQNSTGLFKNLLEAAEFVNQTKFNLKQEIEKQSNIINNQNKQIILQSRTAIMGEMIGNIAHQWRQPLNTIGLYLTDAKLNIMNDGNLTADNSDMLVNDIQEQIIYLSKTIDDFLNFFKPNKEKIDFDLSETVYQSVLLVKKSLNSSGITIKLACCDSEDLTTYSHYTITGYPNELGQVLLNLISNAKDALLEKKVENPLIKVCWGLNPDEQLQIRVKDNAGGIPADIMPKIFDPYFSTKSQKKGSGIGLYMSKTIIEEHHKGTISANNDEFGAIFTIILPYDTGDKK